MDVVLFGVVIEDKGDVKVSREEDCFVLTFPKGPLYEATANVPLGKLGRTDPTMVRALLMPAQRAIENYLVDEFSKKEATLA